MFCRRSEKEGEIRVQLRLNFVLYYAAQHEAVVESVILTQVKTRHVLSTEVMERIEQLGLARSMAGEMSGKVSEKARVAGEDERA